MDVGAREWWRTLQNGVALPMSSEFGHMLGELGDENDGAPVVPASDAIRPNTFYLAGGLLPPLDPPGGNPALPHIEWNHWIKEPFLSCPAGTSYDQCAAEAVIRCPSANCPGGFVCPPQGEPICRTPLPTANPAGIPSPTDPVGLYQGGLDTHAGYRSQYGCIMGYMPAAVSPRFFCKVCQEQLVVDIHRLVDARDDLGHPQIIRSAEAEPAATVVNCEVVLVRQPATHDLSIEWRLDDPEAVVFEAGGIAQLDITGLDPGSNHVVYLKVADSNPRVPGGDPWVHPEYYFVFKRGTDEEEHWSFAWFMLEEREFPFVVPEGEP